MNLRQLKSKKWQSIVYIGTFDGKKKFVTVTADSKQECKAMAEQVKAEAEANKNTPKMTVLQAVDRYIEAKRGVLSPSTVAGYVSKRKLYIERHPIGSCLLDKLTNEQLQQWVSSLSETLAKKTVTQAYGLLSSSVRMFRPKADLSVKYIKFPQGKKYKGYVPSTDEVIQVLHDAKEYDERLYRACLLSAFATLRRGEISPLTAEDLRGNILHIEKDMVKDASGKWITKLPKTEDSVRDVRLPMWIVDEMPKTGTLVDYRPDEITKFFGRLVKKSGLPHFRFHDLRKHAVSLMATQGVSMASIKDIGGWSNLQTPQQIYIKALADAHEREVSQYVSFLDTISTKL